MVMEPASQDLHGLDQGEREEASQRTTAFGQGIAQGRAHRALEQMPSGIEGALTAAIPRPTRR